MSKISTKSILKKIFKGKSDKEMAKKVKKKKVTKVKKVTKPKTKKVKKVVLVYFLNVTDYELYQWDTGVSVINNYPAPRLTRCKLLSISVFQ